MDSATIISKKSPAFKAFLGAFAAGFLQFIHSFPAGRAEVVHNILW